MKVGDKVRFLDFTGGGTIMAIDDDGCVIVTDVDGFLTPALPSQLVVVDDVGDKLLMTRKVRRKSEQSALIKPAPKHYQSYPLPVTTAAIEVNLHSEALGMSTALSPHDQKKRQLECFRRTMNKYRKQKGLKIIFIHGKGAGILRAEILRELRSKYPHCTVQDAPFSHYGLGGATEVIIG